jgi:hypothetical protein
MFADDECTAFSGTAMAERAGFAFLAGSAEVEAAEIGGWFAIAIQMQFVFEVVFELEGGVE